MSRQPQGWETAELREVAADISYGFTTSSIPDGDGPKLLRITDIQDGSVNWSAVPHCVDTPRIDFFLQEGDIVIARTGATTGKSFLIRELPDRAVFASYLIRARLSDSIEPEYAWAFMQSADYWSQIQIVSKGTAQPGANAGLLSQLQFPIAPISEQRRIVAKINSLSTKSRRTRDNLDHVPRLVEKYKQAILAAAYDGNLTRTIAGSQSTLPIAKMIDSLDQGWSPKCESEPAVDPQEWAVIKTTAIQAIHFLPGENKKLPASLTPRANIVIDRGDVLITRAGPRSRVAIACLVKETRPRLMLCDKAYRLRVNPTVADAAFLTLMLNAPQSLETLERMKTGISDSGLNLTQSKFLDLTIPNFSLAAQQEIVQLVETGFAWIDRLASEATRARKLIDHLDQAVLAKAFRGELVPQDPNDEPASVLLDRIRAERDAAAVKAKAAKKAPQAPRRPKPAKGTPRTPRRAKRRR